MTSSAGFSIQRSLVFTLGIVFLAVSTVAINGQILTKQGTPQVKLTNNCSLTGKVETSRGGRSYASFIGIPYGHVPQRFGNAVKAPAWTGTLNAVTAGPLCVQPHSGKAAELTTGFIGAEDCLNLNVYVPTNTTTTGKKQRKEGLPVMVWIHGGGFVNGAGSIYGPKYFMDENVILVTLNYRLNVFGFLSTGDNVISGNNGLKDQVLALEWVQENIKSFNGDPTRVTVFGESAGGASVHLLYLSPTTNGLFTTAIAQSGSGLAPWSFHPNPKDEAVKLATLLKCPTTTATTAAGTSQISSQEILDCLRKEPVDKLVQATLSFARWPQNLVFPLQFGPVKESSVATAAPGTPVPFLTKASWDIIRDKTTPLKNITFITGVTEDEGATIYSGSVLQDPKLVEELNSNWNTLFPRAFELDKFMSLEEQVAVAEKVRNFYFQDRPISEETRTELMNLYSDIYFVYSVRSAALLTAARGKKNPVYLYQFAQHSPIPFMKAFGYPVADVEAQKVGHADELLMLFNMEEAVPGIQLDVDQEEFSRNMVKLWATLAYNGKPKHSWGAWGEYWKPLSREEIEGRVPLKYFKLDSDPSYVTEESTRVAFWNKMCNEHFQNFCNVKPSPPTKATRNEL